MKVCVEWWLGDRDEDDGVEWWWGGGEGGAQILQVLRKGKVYNFGLTIRGL